MRKDVDIILVEDDEGHAFLIRSNLERSGVTNNVIHINDGQKMLDLMCGNTTGVMIEKGRSYVVLLDIHLPKVSGIEVLKKLKSDPRFKKIPVVMITTSDDPDEIKQCYAFNCNTYIKKPVEYNKFTESIRRLGMYLSIIEVPKVNGGDAAA